MFAYPRCRDVFSFLTGAAWPGQARQVGPSAVDVVTAQPGQRVGFGAQDALGVRQLVRFLRQVLTRSRQRGPGRCRIWRVRVSPVLSRARPPAIVWASLSSKPSDG